MTRLAVLVVAAALAAGSGAGATTQSGLHGVVTRGPISPVCVAEQPCSAPAPGVTLVFTSTGQEAVRTRTGSAGAYRVALAPGLYTVAPLSGRRMEPGTTRVVNARFRHVDFSIDTGIR